MDLEEKASLLPPLPGVYLFRDAGGQILYVGKARSLRTRVRSYFAGTRLADAKTGTLLREAADLDYILVDNEKEALALENSLIKTHRPRFNILLRDDKTYPFIRLTAFEPFPRVYVTRRILDDGSEYFGPYFPHNLAHRIVRFINRYFQIPSCRCDLSRTRERPCPGFLIHRCLGPQMGNPEADARYRQAVEQVRLFLQGRLRDLKQQLRTAMEQAVEREEFERAAAYRDLLATVEEMEERQKMAAVHGDDSDVVGFYAEPPLVAVNVFHIRGGRVVDRREFYWENLECLEPAELIASVLKQLYLDARYIPRRIDLPVAIEERELLEELLAERSQHSVQICVPRRGTRRRMVELVMRNAQHSFLQRFRILRPDSSAIAEALQQTLGLEEPPQCIECFDVSHLQGSDAVASVVVWERGRMNKAAYRRFLLRETPGNDDFAGLREAVRRRYRRLLAEGARLPDLILIDGGPGQLHAAVQALDELGLSGLTVASIAKKEELIYLYGNEDEPVRLEARSPVLHLIQQIRDETHRFAVSFHRRRRTQRTLTSVLEQIPGVGERTARRLLAHFGSLAGIRRAGLEALAQVVPRARAEAIWQFLEGTGQQGVDTAPITGSQDAGANLSAPQAGPAQGDSTPRASRTRC
jgi:excinuclease ABC subunit C